MPEESTPRPLRLRSATERSTSGPVADRVASIIAAAEATAERLRRDAETRMEARIAEGARAAQNRVDAAEAEADELLGDARTEAERVLRDGTQRDETAKTTATSEALGIIARAQESADETLREATETAARQRAAATRESRELLSQARTAADTTRGEGLELVGNLRAMGDSLHANAERLLRDVQALHGQMIARIEVVEATRRSDAENSTATSERENGRRTASADADELPDVPEFMPRRGAR